MSDNSRESFTDKASKALKPEGQKSGTEQLTDSLKGKADSLASTMQPESQKSGAQKVGDTLTGKNDKSPPSDKSLIDSAKDAMGMGSNK